MTGARSRQGATVGTNWQNRTPPAQDKPAGPSSYSVFKVQTGSLLGKTSLSDGAVLTSIGTTLMHEKGDTG